MEKTCAVILAGGSGTRLKSDIPKQFMPLCGRPVLAWSCMTCNNLDEIDRVLVVAPAEYVSRAEDILKQYGIRKAAKIVRGGATRQESAYNALSAADFHENDILVFHDAARPFISRDVLRNCLADAKLHGAAAVYTPANDTVAEIHEGFVVSVPPRERFFSAQTPQAFRYSIIMKAHRHALDAGLEATDDTALALTVGFKVKMVEGDRLNFKITTDFDYRCACILAENIIAQSSK
jgi:2-C-methyl-D-erythritol 4-phosphate cytidylyltransferase